MSTELNALKERLAKVEAQKAGNAARAPAAAAPAANSTQERYYSPPSFYADAEALDAAVESARAAMEERSAALKESQKAMEAMRSEAEARREKRQLLQGKLQGDGAAALYQQLDDEWTAAVQKYVESYQAFETEYNSYKPYEDSYNNAVDAYNAYQLDQQNQYNQWRSTIRGSEEIAAEQAEVARKRTELQNLMQLSNGYSAMGQAAALGANEARIAELREYLGAAGEREKLLAEEMEYSNYFRYEDKRNAEDFGQLSQYQSTANGRAARYDPVGGGMYGSGFDDPLYDYINRNGQAVAEQTANNHLNDMSYLESMTDDEIAMYNYVYAKEGAEAAKEYLDTIRTTLTARQMGKTQETVAQMTSGPLGGVVGSLFSVGLSPIGGLQSVAGQVGSLLSGKEIDPNASYNLATSTKNTIRQAVSGEIEAALGEKWGPVGSFGYNVGMSMADMLMDASFGSAGVAKALIGSRAFSESVMDAKNRGLSDGQALTLGAVGAVAELATERIGLDELLKLKDADAARSMLGRIWKGAAGEGAEEGLTNVINLVADLAVGGEQSQFRQNAAAYQEQGMSESQAFAKAVQDAALSLGADVLGGMASGGVFGGFDRSGGESAADAQQKEKNAANPAANTEEDSDEEIPDGTVDNEERHHSEPEDHSGEERKPGFIYPDKYHAWLEGVVAGGEAEKNTPAAGQPDGDAAYNGGVNDAQTGEGERLLPGGRERDDGPGTREQAAARAEREAQRQEQYQRSDAAAAQRRVKAENLEKLGKLQRVSAQDLGLKVGTQNKELLELPRYEWDSELYDTVHRLEQETGMKVRCVTQSISIQGKRGTELVKGAIDRVSGRIVLNVCHSTVTAGQIADHELYHWKMDAVGRISGDRFEVTNRAVQRIQEEYDPDDFDAVADAYVDALEGIYDTSDWEGFVKRVYEEIMADAYAGINAFGVDASRYQSTVNHYLEEEGLGRNVWNANAQADTVVHGEDQRLYSDEDAPPLPDDDDVPPMPDYEAGDPLPDDDTWYSIDKDFSDQVDDVLAGKFNRRSQVYVGQTPAILGQIGLNDSLPMLTTSKHIRMAVAAKNAARHTHGLTVQQIKDIPRKLGDPVMVLDALDHSSNSIIVVTDMLDPDGDPVIVPVKADGQGKYNNVVVDTNFVVSYYGRNNFEGFLSRIIQDDGILYINQKKAAALSAKSNTQWFGKLKGHDFDVIIRKTRAIVKGIDDSVSFSVDDTPGELSQERIDAMVKKSEEVFGRKVKAETEAGLRSEARRMERNRERAKEHAEERKRHHDEAKAVMAANPSTSKETNTKPLFAKRDARKRLIELFSVPEGERAGAVGYIESFLDEVLKRGELTDIDRRTLLDGLIERGVVTVEPDEILVEGRSYLKDHHIYVSESLKQEFGDDWDRVRKKAFGLGVWLTDDSKYAGVDMWFQDMAGYLPGMFDTRETDQRTMLERMLWIAEEGKAEKMNLADYTKMIAKQEHQSEAELLESMARQMDKILERFGQDAGIEVRMRKYTKKAVGRERLYRAADKAHYREHLQRMRNRRELNELQNRTLKTLQWLNRNKHRATEELQARITEVLSDIDLYAIGAANELNWHPRYQMTWRDLTDVYKEARKNDPNFIPTAELDRIMARLDNRKIADMDIAALNDLFNAAVGLRKEMFDADRLLSSKDGERLDGLYTEAVGEMEQAEKGKKGSVWDRFFNVSQLTPMNIIRQMGGWRPDGALARMAELLEKGERDTRAFTVKANRILEDYLNDHADWIHKADGQGKDGIWIKTEVPELMELGMGDKPIFGDTVEVWMTPMQRVHLYLESRNYDNLRHMVGGRTFADKELYSQGKRQEAFAAGRTIRMAPETVQSVLTGMTAEELELANLLDQYYNGLAHDEINRVSQVLYGYNKAMGGHYAPIFTNQNYTKSEAGVFDQTAEGVGNLKARMHAGNPSLNISALDAFERNVDKTAEFVGMSIPVRDWNSLLNWRTKDSSMKDQISHEWGIDRLKYIERLLVDLQGGTPQETDVLQEATDKLLGNYISSVFGFNPSIVLKQAGSLPLAAVYLGGDNVSRDMFRGDRRNRDLIAKYTQELAWRSMGYAMPETKQLKDSPGWAQRSGKKWVEDIFGGGYITKMDEAVASVLWSWSENKVRKEFPGLEVGTQEIIDKGLSPFYQKVAEEFDRAVSQSQSVSDVMHQSTMRRSKHVMARTFTMFRSDSAQTYNALRQMWGEKSYYERQAKHYADAKGEKAGQMREQMETATRQAGKKVGTAVMATVLNTALAELVNLFVNAVKGRLDKYEDEEGEITVASILAEAGWGMFESCAGVVTGGDEVAALIGAAITGEMQYAAEAPGLEQLVDLTDRVKKVWSDVQEGEILGAVRETGLAFSTYFAGFPAENIEKYIITGAVKWLFPGAATGYEDAMEAPTKEDLKGLEGAALEVRLGNVLKGYGVETDENTRKVLAELYGAGYTNAVAGGPPDSVKVDDAELELDSRMRKSYDKTRAEVLNQELAEIVNSPFFTDADEQTRTKMLERLYNYAAETAKAALFPDYEVATSAAEIQEIADAGGSIADCVIFKAITGEIGDQPAMKNYMQADLLREWDAAPGVKELMFRHLVTDSQDEEITALKDAGLGFNQFLEVYAMHGQIDAQEMDAGAKATNFAYWLDGQRYTDAQKAVIKEEMEYRTSMRVDATKYNRAVEAGLSRDEATELAEELNALEPLEGKTQVIDIQKWRVAVDNAWAEENQLQMLQAAGMSGSTYDKVSAAWDMGIAPAAWVRTQELKPDFDSDGNGRLTNDDWEDLIDSMCTFNVVLPGNTNTFHLTAEQKSFLWQMLTGSKSTKNNPYGSSGGEKWLAVKGE